MKLPYTCAHCGRDVLARTPDVRRAAPGGEPEPCPVPLCIQSRGLRPVPPDVFPGVDRYAVVRFRAVSDAARPNTALTLRSSYAAAIDDAHALDAPLHVLDDVPVARHEVVAIPEALLARWARDDVADEIYEAGYVAAHRDIRARRLVRHVVESTGLEPARIADLVQDAFAVDRPLADAVAASCRAGETIDDPLFDALVVAGGRRVPPFRPEALAAALSPATTAEETSP